MRRLFGMSAALALPGALFADSAIARCPPSRRCGEKCCPSGARCKRGRCRCRSGLKKCGKTCVNLGGDPANCGSCGHACAAGQTCASGQCTGGSVDPTTPVCGDGKAEGTEICDGVDLKGATCQSLGFLSGTLGCGANCTYDTSNCTSPDCTTAADCPQGPVGGCQKAVCVSGACGFESSGCQTCGNGVKEGTEQCDGNDFGGATCQSLGFAGGTLTCGSNCTFDTSNCGASGCISSTECGSLACIDGTCGPCAATSQCVAPHECVDGTCQLILPP